MKRVRRERACPDMGEDGSITSFFEEEKGRYARLRRGNRPKRSSLKRKERLLCPNKKKGELPSAQTGGEGEKGNGAGGEHDLTQGDFLGLIRKKKVRTGPLWAQEGGGNATIPCSEWEGTSR